MLAKVSIPVISRKKIHMQQDLILCENVCWRADFTACRSPLSRAAVAQPNVVCSTAGCPKVSPGVAECPTVHDMAFQDCFHSCLLFRSGNCKRSGLIVDFQIQNHRMLWSVTNFFFVSWTDGAITSLTGFVPSIIDFERSSPVKLLILLCFFFFNTIYLFNQCLHSLFTVRQLVCRGTNKTK